MEEIVKLWKLPPLIDIEGMRKLKGNEGTFLNPVQDINGDWFVSQEEYDSIEFQYLKTDFTDWVTQFVLSDYIKPIDTLLDEFGNP
jgi:hypothetical protein